MEKLKPEEWSFTTPMTISPSLSEHQSKAACLSDFLQDFFISERVWAFNIAPAIEGCLGSATICRTNP